MPHGQEIYLFFYRFGTKGLLGIIICNIIMAIIIYKTLKILYENNINTYKNFLDKIFLENEKLSNITNIIINVFLCATFFIMISGFGTYLSQAFGMNQIIGSSILALISYIVFLRKIESFAKINNIVNVKEVCNLCNEYDIVLIAYENEKENTLKKELKNLKKLDKEEIKVAVIIGPEGGIAPEEIEMFEENGAKIITLGNRILRTETVALSVLSIIMYELEK